jgi:hypothetical protein
MDMAFSSESLPGADATQENASEQRLIVKAA